MVFIFGGSLRSAVEEEGTNAKVASPPAGCLAAPSKNGGEGTNGVRRSVSDKRGVSEPRLIPRLGPGAKQLAMIAAAPGLSSGSLVAVGPLPQSRVELPLRARPAAAGCDRLGREGRSKVKTIRAVR
jgi:hypothetical protein